MEQQVNLFDVGLKKPKELIDQEEKDAEFDELKETIKEETFKVEEEIKDDRYSWTQIPKDRKKQGLNYIHLELMTSSNLHGTRCCVTSSEANEHPHSMLGSSWGSGGKTFNPNKLDEIQEYFNAVMERKKERLQTTYRKFTEKEIQIAYDYHNIYYEFRLIPAENHIIIISDKLIDMIEQTGFDFDKWYQKYKSLPENKATDDHWKKAKEILELRKHGDGLAKRLTAIDEILKTNTNLRDTLDFFTMTKKEIQQEFEELPHQLKNVSDKILESQNYLGSKTYSTPFSWELKKYLGKI